MSKYKEPNDFIPKDIRKKYKLGEFAEDEQKQKEEKDKLNKDFRDYVKNK